MGMTDNRCCFCLLIKLKGMFMDRLGSLLPQYHSQVHLACQFTSQSLFFCVTQIHTHKRRMLRGSGTCSFLVKRANMWETHSLMAPVCWSSRRPLGVAAKFSRLSNNVSSHIILLERHTAWAERCSWSLHGPVSHFFRTFTKAQIPKVCFFVDLRALRHVSRRCGHCSGVRGRTALRQGTGLDTKTAN